MTIKTFVNKYCYLRETTSFSFEAEFVCTEESEADFKTLKIKPNKTYRADNRSHPDFGKLCKTFMVTREDLK